MDESVQMTDVVEQTILHTDAYTTTPLPPLPGGASATVGMVEWQHRVLLFNGRSTTKTWILDGDNAWISGVPTNKTKCYSTATALASCIVVADDYSVECLQNDRWVMATPCPGAPGAGFRSTSIYPNHEQLLVVPTEIEDEDVHRYDPHADRWTCVDSCAICGDSNQLFTLNGIAYIVGYVDDRYEPMRLCKRYDYRVNRWDTVAPLELRVTGATAVAIPREQRSLVIGGDYCVCTGRGCIQSQCPAYPSKPNRPSENCQCDSGSVRTQEYDERADCWSLKSFSCMSRNLYCHAALFIE